jgi:hypothetical protein
MFCEARSCSHGMPVTERGGFSTAACCWRWDQGATILLFDYWGQVSNFWRLFDTTETLAQSSHSPSSWTFRRVIKRRLAA